jgi:hypothetical protein
MVSYSLSFSQIFPSIKKIEKNLIIFTMMSFKGTFTTSVIQLQEGQPIRNSSTCLDQLRQLWWDSGYHNMPLRRPSILDMEIGILPCGFLVLD